MAPSHNHDEPTGSFSFFQKTKLSSPPYSIMTPKKLNIVSHSTFSRPAAGRNIEELRAPVLSFDKRLLHKLYFT